MSEQAQEKEWLAFVEEQEERLELYTRYNYAHVNEIDIKAGDINFIKKHDKMPIKVIINKDTTKTIDVELNQEAVFNGEHCRSSKALQSQQRYPSLMTVSKILDAEHTDSVEEALHHVEQEGEQHD
ncbi:hypothetical protein N9R04_06320 [Staphylococcus sp. SQ8-PEA]|uniref:Phage protein n=1 Tax=Staphylococcus marylandisciuri TaxID=2981529 RepID=A0ABT2QQV1_9STAP|nr:hypothetical protein [Staphylococcus marylandisciuri]